MPFTAFAGLLLAILSLRARACAQAKAVPVINLVRRIINSLPTHIHPHITKIRPKSP